MQQTVMDSMESSISLPQETNNVADTCVPNQEPASEGSLTYNQLFPQLPNAKLNSEDINTPQSSWTNKNANMRIASTIITNMFRIPNAERAKIESQFGESASSRICADITNKTGANIEISTAKDQSLTVLITGKTEDVLKAKRLTLDKFQEKARQIVKVPKEHHKFVLGKKGKKLQELEAMSGAKIQVPNAQDTSIDISVHGTKECIEKAVHEIQLITDEQNKQAYEKLEIPKIYHPFIHPNVNDKLAQLVSEHNVRVNIPPPSIPKDEITIAGEKEGVIQCKELVTKIYQQMEKKCQTVSVEVSKSQHKYVIGHRGSNITEILQATNVSVEMPPPDSPLETITLRGPQEKLGQALTKVYEKANSVVTQIVTAPPWLHKFIIGRKGANVKLITQDYPQVHVEFTDQAGGIRLEGPPEEVEKARDKLEAMVKNLEETLSFDELNVDATYLKNIIGKSGANINRVRNDNNVTISINENDGKNVIRVEGNREDVAKVKQELIEMIAKMENEREREILIENRFHRNIIGSKGEKIREIREQFNQVQVTFPDQRGEKSDAVKIRGPKNDVDGCYKYMQKLSKELLENNFQLKVSIFRQFHRFIIGKAGATINKIREETSTRVDLPAEGQNSDEIVITGKKKNCEKAKEMISKIQNEMANITTMDIIIPSRFHNAIIGAGGKLIHSISEDCGGVSIKFPPSESKSDKVTIRGPKEDVQRAKQMLMDLTNEKQLSSCTAEVRAKPDLHSFLIGRNGTTIRKIRDKTGVRIIFPTEKDTDRELITIIGKKESVEEARAELSSIISELNDVVEDSMEIDPKYHSHFVSRRGDVLRQIAEQYGGVTISFPRLRSAPEKSSIVTLRGIRECVDGAKDRLREIVSDLQQIVTIEVEIQQRYHRTVMGTRGMNVKEITSDFDVHIKFPDKDMSGGEDVPVENGDVSPRPCDLVVVQGRMEKCEQAKEALLARVPIVVKVDVPLKHHRYIIGQKGETVRSLMAEFDVKIEVPPAQDECDVITVIGPPANVENAKEALLKKVDELLLEEEDRALRSFKLELKIDPEYHPRIIGRKGVVITKIRSKHDVNIQLPSRGSEEDDLITISGYETNCHEARDAILAITGDLENMTRRSVAIDRRIHSRLIGARGKAIRKVMETYKVEIKFPRGDEEPDSVLVMGPENNVEECIEHLLNLAEEYLQDIDDRAEEGVYTKAPKGNSSIFGGDNEDNRQNKVEHGFVVDGAPWTQPTPDMESSEDFPSIGGPAVPSMTPAWGPRRI